jgi:hypothetical protein
MAWPNERLDSVTRVFDVLEDLEQRRWICRGHARNHPLFPSIERAGRDTKRRQEKLIVERKSIDLFRSAVRFFSHPGEQAAMHTDLVALMILRHYGVPTRLLDWTSDPFVAALFAVNAYDGRDGEIWTFEHDAYATNGAAKWRQFPETTTDGSGDADKFDMTLRLAFSDAEPNDWIVCAIYPGGFHRQNAQKGLYSVTARFNRDHSAMLESLIADNSKIRRYIVSGSIKSDLRNELISSKQLWIGSMYPDVAGAARLAEDLFKTDRKRRP